MNRTSAVSRIQQGLGFRSDLDDTIVSALQEAQRRLEKGRTLPVFLRKEAQSLSVASGSGAISLPTGFIREHAHADGKSMWYFDSDGNLAWIQKLAYDEALDKYTGADAGPPAAYVLRAESLLIYPSRDTSYTAYWDYYKTSVSLATNVSTNEWLQEDTGNPEALIGRAGMIIAEDLGDALSLQKFSKMYAEAWGNAIGDSIIRETEGDPIHIGGRL